jgi:hypothetical protein
MPRPITHHPMMLRGPFAGVNGLRVVSPVSTRMEPSGRPSPRTRSPALSAALTARRTWAWVKVTARVIGCAGVWFDLAERDGSHSRSLKPE